jgi:hypothetical protein
MKIQHDKYDDLIFNMLINIQTDLQVIRNFVLNDHVERTGKTIDIVSREYEDMYESIQVTILSQIKSRFVDKSITFPYPKAPGGSLSIFPYRFSTYLGAGP